MAYSVVDRAAHALRCVRLNKMRFPQVYQYKLKEAVRRGSSESSEQLSEDELQRPALQLPVVVRLNNIVSVRAPTQTHKQTL